VANGGGMDSTFFQVRVDNLRNFDIFHLLNAEVIFEFNQSISRNPLAPTFSSDQELL